MESKNELYATLTRVAEAYTETTHTLSRFEMLKVMDELGVEPNRDSMDLVDKLYADGFVNE